MQQTITIPVCASSPEDARDKAMEECNRMCSTNGERDQCMGEAMYNGKMLKKYMRRRVYDANPIKTLTKC